MAFQVQREVRRNWYVQWQITDNTADLDARCCTRPSLHIRWLPSPSWYDRSRLSTYYACNHDTRTTTTWCICVFGGITREQRTLSKIKLKLAWLIPTTSGWSGFQFPQIDRPHRAELMGWGPSCSGEEWEGEARGTQVLLLLQQHAFEGVASRQHVLCCRRTIQYPVLL